jgi:alginate O-acetyltransferase complex protein AlgI
MLFNSLHFLLFLPTVVALYYLLPFRFRWILIFLASCYFYMAFIPAYILILFLVIIIDYFSGILIENSQGRKRQLFLIASLVSNISLLAFFKYFNFLSGNVTALLSLMGTDFQIRNLDIILPIGLSFHTFQSMSYTIEVYRGKQKAERHIGYFADYVLFFPQMVAGPIERYEHLGVELHQRHPARYQNFAAGFRLILFGLFIKMAVADNIAPYVNEIYSDPLRYGAREAILATLLFSFQIYADFYGYSTIALGSARLMGINIMDNFKTPYLSRSISEFWSRWHISLSSWFRDYLYIPLGGNRVPVPRWCFNILFVFMVSGLWHGASWTFVIWGALHGLSLLGERLFPVRKADSGRFRLIDFVLVVKTFLLTTFIWIFFRAESFEKASNVIKVMFSGQSVPDGPDVAVPLAFAGIMLCMDLFLYNTRFDHRLAGFPFAARWLVYAAVLFGLFALSGTQKFAFIYFQF